MAKTFRGNEYLGIRIPTIFGEGDARRCAGCGLRIEGKPFRISLMDIVSSESPPWWDRGAALNPGPHQFHEDPACVRRWCREKGYLVCRHSTFRQLMRPVRLPVEGAPWGLCDGIHRDAHEFVPA